ncbi:uncharacterized protein BHQ10_009267 [Talaromyces amestolkiae]|uniref:VOC domain-containing protein n=1 Tax=Talaromyces amestolkiae TaxID=1196081 RepID=A0A364LBQ1_TALAM|nr:uncharacterized protein BHQ10_009267 [Talaromyces amestolkiae]RAO73255.1 hypothetical protein BHQ10_009267 [Talaromyces amestolkiae]
MEKIHVQSLAYVHYQHPDLEQALRFLSDFGLVEAQRDGGKVFLRGYGVDPYCYIAETSPDGARHFKGAYFRAQDLQQLHKAASLYGGSPVCENYGPGGGQVVTLTDPNGISVGVIAGQALRNINARDEEAGTLELTPQVANSVIQKPRKGDTRRFKLGASPVHKFGHYGINVPIVKYKETLEWYTTVFNLSPTDCIYDPVSGEDTTCFTHIDLGSEFTDHHSFFVAGKKDATKAYVHHSSFEVNDFDTQTLGHDWLMKNGWTNCWGIGRHVLGSQIFDYWYNIPFMFDPSGNVVEHYSDGDLVNKGSSVAREPAAPSSLYVWGPNLPLAFMSGKMEDAGKVLVAPPDASNAKAAHYQTKSTAA